MQFTSKKVSELSDSRRQSLAKWHGWADFLFNKARFYGSRKLYRYISKSALPELNEKVYSPTIYGFDLVVGPDNSYDYYYLGFYETGALHIFKEILGKGDIFIDVGANIGLMSFYASIIVGDTGKVISFEPTRTFFEDFTNGIKKNNFQNIIPFKKGLGKEEGSFPIYFNSVCPSLIKVNDNDTYEIIEIETLDEVIKKLQISNVRLIKIDVEGFELEVIRGGVNFFSSPDGPIICIEYVKDQQIITENGENALHWIKKINNYRFFQLEKSSDTISKLIEVFDFTKLHPNDNVFCLLQNHIIEFGYLIKK